MEIVGGEQMMSMSKGQRAKALISPHLTRKNGFIFVLFLVGLVMLALAGFCVPDDRDHEISNEEKQLVSCPDLGIAGPRYVKRKVIFIVGMLVVFSVCCCPFCSIDSIRNETQLVQFVRQRRAERHANVRAHVSELQQLSQA